MERNSEIKPEQTGSINPAAPDFLSSHPSTPERVTQAIANARQYKAPASVSPQEREQARDAYFDDIDGMVFGEDPSEGFVRGRRFLHPKLGFTFTAPEGFTLDNTAQAVLGVKRGGGEALRLDVVRVPAEQTLSQYLNSGWIENIDAATVEDVTINGFPGATAVAKGDQWDFRLYAIRFGSDVYRFIFAAKHRTAETDRSFRESIGFLPPHEPCRNRTGQAASGENPEGRAGRHGGEAGGPDGACRPRGRAFPCTQRDRAGRPVEAGQRSQDRGRVAPFTSSLFAYFLRVLRRL